MKATVTVSPGDLSPRTLEQVCKYESNFLSVLTFMNFFSGLLSCAPKGRGSSARDRVLQPPTGIVQGNHHTTNDVMSFVRYKGGLQQCDANAALVAEYEHRRRPWNCSNGAHCTGKSVVTTILKQSQTATLPPISNDPRST